MRHAKYTAHDSLRCRHTRGSGVKSQWQLFYLSWRRSWEENRRKIRRTDGIFRMAVFSLLCCLKHLPPLVCSTSQASVESAEYSECLSASAMRSMRKRSQQHSKRPKKKNWVWKDWRFTPSVSSILGKQHTARHKLFNLKNARKGK